MSTYESLLNFYAHQMWALDGVDIEEFIQTFAADASLDHGDGRIMTGHADMRTQMARRAQGLTPFGTKHWVGNLSMIENNHEAHCTFYTALTTVGDASIRTFTVEDIVQKTAQGFLVSRRRIAGDREAV